MANEFRNTGSITVTPDTAQSSYNVPINATIDMTGTIVIDEIISVTSVGTAVDLGSMGTPKMFFFENRGVGSYISYSHDNANWGPIAHAGKPAGPFAVPNSTLYLKSTSGTVDCRVLVTEA